MTNEKLARAFDAFDKYNSADPNLQEHEGKSYPKEVLYALRMTKKLSEYEPGASESLMLAARCQHIGRWEIPRGSYPMDRKGYLQWRNQLKFHHSQIAEKILSECGYDNSVIDHVKFLLQKKELHQHHPDTQLLEDIICLVFIEFYLEEFIAEHEEEKVVDILKKTLKKMSVRAQQEALKIPVSNSVKELIQKAVA